MLDTLEANSLTNQKQQGTRFLAYDKTISGYFDFDCIQVVSKFDDIF